MIKFDDLDHVGNGAQIMEMREIESLLQPGAYPDVTSTVVLKQTHVSYLLMTDKYVYKVKKPVDLGFLDFTTIDRRRFYCNEEVRLNRRLSPEIYLGVVEIRKGAEGFTFVGEGPIADYAVKMVRMPEERMLHRLLAAGTVTGEDIKALAGKVAQFHLSADCGPELAQYGSIESISGIWEENFSHAACFVGETIAASDLDFMRGWVASFLREHSGLFQHRAAEGFIRNCDGDLHLENICLGENIWIFDCIEFNDRFRYIDTAADIAFLVMDLEFHCRPDLAAAFLDEYCSLTGDRGCLPLVDFYKVYRAFVRGKVASIKLRDPVVAGPEREDARRRGVEYFRMCRGYLLRKLLEPTMILVGGVMGSGKSTVSRLLARELGVQVFSSDRVRKELFRVDAAASGSDAYGAGLYTPEADRATYDELLERALILLRRGESAVIDATFCRVGDRKRFREAAEAVGVRYLLAMTSCPDGEIRRRLSARELVPGGESDGRLAVYEPHLAAFEYPRNGETFIETNTGNTLWEGVDTLLMALGVVQ